MGARSTKKSRTSSIVEGLKDELDARRARVEEIMARHARIVEQGEREIARARADVDAYVSKIARSLGLPDPVARETKRRETLRLRKLVRERVGRDLGVTARDLARELGLEVDVVSPVLGKDAPLLTPRTLETLRRLRLAIDRDKR